MIGAPPTEIQVINALGLGYRELSLSLLYTDDEPGQFVFVARLDMDERQPVTDEQARAILDIFSGVLDDVED